MTSANKEIRAVLIACFESIASEQRKMRAMYVAIMRTYVFIYVAICL